MVVTSGTGVAHAITAAEADLGGLHIAVTEDDVFVGPLGVVADIAE